LGLRLFLRFEEKRLQVDFHMQEFQDMCCTESSSWENKSHQQIQEFYTGSSATKTSWFIADERQYH
jgi:hypothetical protein